jgi:hypothetical protein
VNHTQPGDAGQPVTTRITWMRVDQAARLHLYPAAGAALQTLAGPCDQPIPVLLAPITDHSFRWR